MPILSTRRFGAAIPALALAGGVSTTSFAQMSMSGKHDPMVGGAAMYPSKNIVENAVNSKDHTTLVAAVKAGGLVDTLESAGPFTVFAPTNEAFAKLPPGTVDGLLNPDNKARLVAVLTYHVVPGAPDLGRPRAQGQGGRRQDKPDNRCGRAADRD